MDETKESILKVALELFSQRGFSAVSIRAICKEVNIKESSVYYHFKNKQAIFDELIDRFKNIAIGMMNQLERSMMSKKQLTDDFYSTVSDSFFENYLLDDFCNKVIRIMMIEQFCNDEIKNTFHQWLFVEPLKFQSHIFEMLMEIGIIKRGNSEYLAIKYYAPVFFFAQKWLFSGELSEEKKNAFRSDATRHIQSFFTEIGGMK